MRGERSVPPPDDAALSDAYLLACSKASPSAFRAVYDRHARRIHLFLLRRTRDEQTALDLTAETFAQAWLSRERFRDQADGSAAPWLFAIARHLLAHAVRRGSLETAARERLGLLTGLDRTAVSATPDAGWVDAGLAGDLSAALEDLPREQRAAVELRVLDDLGYREIARTLDCTEGAARVRVSRGLKSLRTSMERISR